MSGVAYRVISPPPAATPTFSPPAGSYGSSQSVTISSSTPNSSIYYTTNGTTPTLASPLYTGPITVSSSETVQAIVETAPGCVASSVGSAVYTIGGSGGPSAPSQLRINNQTGPNASQETTYGDGAGYGTATPGTGASFNQYQGSTTTVGNSGDYQALTWLPATPGSGGAVSKYNIYRNGSLYDSVATPITITGYIAPTTDTLGQSCGLLHVTAVSGGTSTNGITDAKILNGLKLTSSASGFVAGSKIVAYETAATGGGGTGSYYVDQSQTVGSSGSPQTFTGWAFNDTAATNCCPLFDGTVSVNTPIIYNYTVTAVDASSNEGPPAYPSMYMYEGYSMTGQAQFSFGGSTTWNDTTGSPVNGPYDIMITNGGTSGYGFQPTWGNANGDTNNHSYGFPPCRAEMGWANYFVFDIKPNDSTYNGGVGPNVGPVMRCFGGYQGIDTLAEQSFNCSSFCTPALSAGQWSTCKIPFSAMGYGLATVTAVFTGTGTYQGNLHVTAISAQAMKYFAGATWVTGPGIPANTNLCGGSNGGQGGYTDPQGPYTSPPYDFHCYGPNIIGTENTGSITVQLQASTAYKSGWTPNTSLSGTNGTIFLNNIGFTTV
jgi:Chitobiase/beta-hexosaminidase C-terminal domain